MMEQLVVLRVTYDDTVNYRVPAEWDWKELVGDEVSVVGFGPPEPSVTHP